MTTSMENARRKQRPLQGLQPLVVGVATRADADDVEGEGEEAAFTFSDIPF